ncbi:hypothetical protein CHELA40_11317 [Chelatococcus asaccharovorans]|nr:hypothetical protein CHELA40_11317 [Chelatococcus asaccharovorans]CAH1685003.1 hypothetical protein CHELA17_64282 [Chelatococcus asaccharovorans]
MFHDLLDNSGHFADIKRPHGTGLTRNEPQLILIAARSTEKRGARDMKSGFVPDHRRLGETEAGDSVRVRRSPGRFQTLPRGVPS